VIAAIALILASLVSGCTFIGMDHPALRESMDFGPPETVYVCVYLGNGVSRQLATNLLDGWNQSEAQKYALYVKPVSFTELPRSGFTHEALLSEVYKEPLKPTCDRVLFFVGRDVGDFVYGLASVAFPLPEVLGEVDDPTLTHGFVVAKRATVMQVLITPADATIHELYHLVGCRQHFDMPACYREIAALKAKEAELRKQHYYEKIGEPPFYPTWRNLTGQMLISRAQVENMIAHSGP
jgi:hypothetical protein